MPNILQSVQTFQKSDLALLLNDSPFISDIANTKFKDFQNFTGNLGDTVTFDLPPRMSSNNGLVVTSFTGVEQRKQSLTIDGERNVNFAFSNTERLLNIDPMDYTKDISAAGVAELGSFIEEDVASVIPVHTYRTYGNGNTAINSFGQLASMLALYRNYGSPKDNIKVILPDTDVPAIVNTGLNYFTPSRNDKLAADWRLGSFSNATFYTSNLLPTHTAGTLGQAGTQLTFDSISVDGTEITFTGAGTDANAIKAGDVINFESSSLKFLTFIGHAVSANSVQVRATADAASSGGDVTVTVYPPLLSAAGNNQNLNRALTGADTAMILPSHRCGLVIGGQALYLAMPRLPAQEPYFTGNEYDKETGVSIRLTYGSTLGANQKGFIMDAIWGKTLVDEYAMRIAFPL